MSAALALATFGLLAAGCAGAEAGDPVRTTHVSMAKSYRFAPARIVVDAGSVVTWTNDDNFTHSVRLLDSGEVQMMKPGESVSLTFTTPGLFRYDCSLHPKDMHGSVLVSGGAG
jgi:plastocyanin